MVHYFIGNLGHFFVTLAFVAALIGTTSFFLGLKQASWINFGSIAFYVHALGILGIVISLFTIINQHYFEYHYAWSHTSKFLPIYYQVSSFWNGQEGSFLLWMFWNAILGVVLINTNKVWKAPVMIFVSLTQVFLTSMILGSVVFDIKIGSSPFLLLRDVIQDQIFRVNSEFIPADGNGLNPLLQNYWMVIHPPTLFLGFASTVVPFAYCMGGLLTGNVREWVRPALPWAQFSALILCVGILMGAYWAYETLNFGGYWNWDPVENAIYVPWLTLIAAIHVMIAYKKNESALKFSIILVIATFVLILYSTFLTRSGILGETSVHSFTDLGLQGQLLIYLFFFLVLSTLLCIKAWKKIPDSEKDTSVFSREFWIFMGAATLCLMAFQVIIPTSIPVYNDILGIFGVPSNLAPPVDQVAFYTKFQLWFAVGIAFLSGTGQFFWWKKMDQGSLLDELKSPLLITLVISGILFLLAKVHDLSYLLLLLFSVYSIVANTKILLSLKKTNLRLAGGSVAHIGIAMMLIGIIFSSGYSKILSKNTTGMLWSRELPDEINQNNLLLFLHEPRPMEGYSLTYKGIRKKTKSHGFVDIDYLIPTLHPLQVVATTNIETQDQGQIPAGDTLHLINGENSYFEVLYETNEGKSFTLFPRVQQNKAMGTVYSPDIDRTLFADLYTHVRTFPDPEQEPTWSETEFVSLKPGDTFFVNDYAGRFIGMEPIRQIAGVALEGNDVAVKARLEIQGEAEIYQAEPIYVIKDRMAGKIPFVVNDLASKIHIESIQPESNSLTFGIQTTQKDWIILEAVEKPLINILWTGTLLLVVGFVIAIRRRYLEFIKMRDKGVEL